MAAGHLYSRLIPLVLLLVDGNFHPLVFHSIVLCILVFFMKLKLQL